MTPSLPAGYHSPQLDVDVRLNTNESPWPPPPGFTERLTAELSHLDLNRYPDREAARLREAIAARHDVEPAQVFCANGSNEAIQLLLAARGGPGRSASVFSPTYTLHTHLSRLTGTEVHSHSRGEDFRLEAKVVKEAVQAHSPDVLFLCTPNNPTGTLDGPEIVDAALSSSSLVLVDEAYAEFAGAPSAVARVNSDDLAVVRTFSKAWAMAGLRLGYAVADADLVTAMADRSLPYHLDVTKQLAGRLALAFETEMLDRVREIVSERERVLAELRILAESAYDSAANFILFRPEGSAREVWSALVERSVLVRDLSSAPGLEGCLRVTVGTPQENDRFLEALADIGSTTSE
ncbi:MAG TPA: histidinol-phosphate transaminase [Acidimicrobiales bacterium]|nr:histidinol-phosphate transaminase [Acidimicrobiales bacterium]